MKNKTLYTSFLCILAIFILTVNVYAADNIVQNISPMENNISTENKILCNATLDDNFEDDSVIVVLKKDVNPDFRTLTQTDFPEIQAKNVETLV